jgi:hypothetical protein
MQPRPSFDRGLLIPIAIGVVSILGICWIFLTSRLGERVLPPTVIPSSINSFKATTRTPSPFATSTPDETPKAQTPSTATGTSPDAYPGPSAETFPSPSPFITESLPTPSATSTPENIQPLAAGKYYDDVDPNIAYDWYWTGLKNPGTANAYHGTIHASDRNGDEASFRFTGKRFRLGYQRGRNFGTVTVLIDDQPYSFHEQAFDLVWSSPKLSPGDHFVRIIHESGESINLDYIEILD